jgi:hypothetical protein
MNFEWGKKGDGAQRPIKKLFLAEGYAELGFLNRELSLRKVSNSDVGVYCFKGLVKLSTHRETLINILDTERGDLREIECFGLLADSEVDCVGRRDASISLFKDLEFTKCAQDIVSTGKYNKNMRRVALSLSPSNSINGRIEDLIIEEISKHSHYDKCFSSFHECINDFSGKPLDQKAIVQIYISSVKSDLCGVGRAFESGILDVRDSAYANHQSMIDFILG